MPTSQAAATWEGKLKDGKGSFKAGSGAFSGPYSFATRFEGKKGTNPEELMAAAHAACFSMALAAGLEKAGKPATRVQTDGACTRSRRPVRLVYRERQPTRSAALKREAVLRRLPRAAKLTLLRQT